MSRGLNVATVFSAVDKMTGPVSNMAKNTKSSFAKMERRMMKVSRVSRDVAQKAGTFGLALGAPLALATREAIRFEDAMADVAKVANVQIGTTEFDKLGDSAKTLSKFLAIDATEAAGLMANLAQGGVALKDLDRVSTIAGKVGVAFGISADVAGESFIKTQNALGGTISDTEKLMDAINELGNTTAASSANIINFMSSGGSAAARAAGVSGEAMSAFGAQFIAMGKSAQESATIMERFVKKAMLNSKLRGVFDKAGGGAEGMFAILEKGVSLNGKQQDAYFKQFGEYGLQVQLLAKNMDGLRGIYDTATNSIKTSGSVLKEFENRSNTTAFKLKRAKAEFMDAAITLGNALLPVLTDLTKALTPIITGISKWMKENKELTGTIVKVVAGVAAGAMAISGLSTAISVVSGALAFMTGPIGWVIAGVATLSYTIYKVSDAWDDETAAMRVNREMREGVLSSTRNERAEASLLFKALRDNEEGTTKYTSALSKLEQMSPGIIANYDLQRKSIDKINDAEKNLIKTIQQRAFEQIKAEKVKGLTEKLIRLKEEGASGSEFFWGASGFSEMFSKSKFEARLIAETQQQIQAASSADYNDIMPVVNVPQQSAGPSEYTKQQLQVSLSPEAMKLFNFIQKDSNNNLMGGVQLSPTN